MVITEHDTSVACVIINKGTEIKDVLGLAFLKTKKLRQELLYNLFDQILYNTESLRASMFATIVASYKY